MVAREVERVGVVLEEEWLEVGEGVLLAKEAPGMFFAKGGAMVELDGFELGKLLYQGLVDDKVLMTVLAGRFVLVGTDARLQEDCHLEMGIAQEGRDAKGRGYHLR